MIRDHRKLYEAKLPRRALLVYMYLEDRMNSECKCWPSIRTIARDLNVSEDTVCRGIKDLRNKGLVKVKRRRRSNGANSSNLYEVV